MDLRRQASEGAYGSVNHTQGHIRTRTPSLGRSEASWKDEQNSVMGHIINDERNRENSETPLNQHLLHDNSSHELSMGYADPCSTNLQSTCGQANRNADVFDCAQGSMCAVSILCNRLHQEPQCPSIEGVYMGQKPEGCGTYNIGGFLDSESQPGADGNVYVAQHDECDVEAQSEQQDVVSQNVSQPEKESISAKRNMKVARKAKQKEAKDGMQVPDTKQQPRKRLSKVSQAPDLPKSQEEYKTLGKTASKGMREWLTVQRKRMKSLPRILGQLDGVRSQANKSRGIKIGQDYLYQLLDKAEGVIPELEKLEQATHESSGKPDGSTEPQRRSCGLGRGKRRSSQQRIRHGDVSTRVPSTTAVPLNQLEPQKKPKDPKTARKNQFSSLKDRFENCYRRQRLALELHKIDLERLNESEIKTKIELMTKFSGPRKTIKRGSPAAKVLSVRDKSKQNKELLYAYCTNGEKLPMLE